jgi:DNA-binding SARP family transcriptional activator
LPDAPAFDEWQFFEGEALRDQVADALQRLACWHGERGEHEAAIPYARRKLMALYARSGQRAAALRQYGECERVLEEELGAPPSPETVQLYERIRDRDDLRGTRSLRATSVDENGHALSSLTVVDRRATVPAPKAVFFGLLRGAGLFRSPFALPTQSCASQ